MADVIKEFLVGLGFKVDEKGLKTFTSTIDGATTAVTRLVTTLAGASLTVAAGVATFANNLENLYFASQRIGSSAQSIKAAEYAARDFGATAGELRGSLEGIARFLRDNPGGEGFLQSLGVETRDINGNIKDTADLLSGLGQQLRSMPWYQARQYASVFGIDENTLRAIINGDFARKVEQNRKTLADSGLDQATKDAHAFMEQLRDVGLQFENLSIQVQAQLMHRLGPELEKFAAWFEKNSPMIAARIVDVIEKLLQLAQDSGPYLQGVYDFFVKLDAATDGWSTKIIVLLGLMKALGLTSVVTGILNLAAAFFRLGTGIGSAAAAAAAPALTSLLGTAAVAAVAMLYSSSLNEGEDDSVRARRNAEDDAAGDLRGGADMAARVSNFFEGLGWTKEQAAGIAANLSAESSFDPGAVGDGGQAYGVAQWHPDRQDAFRQWAGKDIRQSTLEEQLRFVHHELTEGNEKRAGDLLRLAKSAGQAGSVVSRHYERPADKDGEAARRSASAERILSATQQIADRADLERALLAEQADDAAQALIRANAASQFDSRAPDRYAAQAAMAQPAQGGQVVIHQKTDVNVSGSADPVSTGQAVAGAQGRVNEELVRNMTSAVN
ncbi:phage tail tip lysozyme [Pseudomonas pseudonitroreducens]|uniref:phage tail tip lysozyme n=1 Tax=Pseudomonas pseudonitroreducens TaxID=2892326 RepID=UPI001F19BC21|nr:phage tail tip lysozyme [Pseudomonas pseudonitroreducens]